MAHMSISQESYRRRLLTVDVLDVNAITSVMTRLEIMNWMYDNHCVRTGHYAAMYSRLSGNRRYI